MPGIEAQHFLAGGLWASYVFSLYLNFSIHKMGKIMVPIAKVATDDYLIK